MIGIKPSHIIIAGATALLLGAACSDDGGSTPDAGTDGAGPDTTFTPDSKQYPDLGALPDMPKKMPCESEWKIAVIPIAKVSTGTVTTTSASGVYTTVIDATAGGMSMASKNPYTYVSLKDGKRVDVDDDAALTSSAWDIAFKRATIRINGGDSGGGQGAVSIVKNTTLDKVTSVPAASTFVTDDFIDAKCVVKKDPIGGILTSFGGVTGMWYKMDTTTMKLTPNPDTYVVKTADGKHVKMYIDKYYDSTGTSAMYTIRWSAL